jgi:hypothetical protein
MGDFTMVFIRAEKDIWRDHERWDKQQADFGYVECERVNPVPLKAIDRERARLEAFQLWHEWCLAPSNGRVAEGYWIVGADGRPFDMEVRDVD